MFTGISLALSLFLSAPASADLTQHTSHAIWQPAIGDHIVVDTNNNMGYLYHNNGNYLSFRVATGQKRNVYYIGRYYNAKTPDRKWEMKTRHVKGDRVTFGPTGRFLRLYNEGSHTAYGIHGHRDANVMLEDNMRFRSMGCIIVSENILNIIENTFEINEGNVSVETVNGLQEVKQ